MGLEIDEERLGAVLEALPTAAHDGVGRHAHFTRQKYETIYGITPETIDSDLNRVFAITVRQRSGTIGNTRLTAAQKRFDADEFCAAETHGEAYKLLTAIDDVGRKIANEYLRKVVHAFEFRDSWVEDLFVPLDTHVTRALVDTKCIHESDGSRTDRTTVGAVFNPNSGSNPSTRIAVDDMQAAFRRVAEAQGTERIAFDELWSENKFHLSIPEFREESCLKTFL
ncbi:hypothetical protein NKF06_16320 [Haloferax sp. AB510]|uniref:hypothetical protein n=1 Tax=Haloferax sp. AB510 TaxID=2934172 RepID=UPI00209C14F9|nr:hypothetical protein [Haloferax sp. AB510]MCO8268106.1 hypothetical protein [Haloferax sp. AB510]